jgi:D-3-phosphoglycerate dehydrogenase
MTATQGDRRRRRTVLLTDHAWSDLELERQIIEGAGFELVAGPELAGDTGAVEALVADSEPEAILTCWAPVSARAIGLPAKLEIVARLGVGLDNIDVDAATRRGAWVTNVPDYCVQEVSDHALALVLDFCRGISRLNCETKRNGWRSDAAGLLRLSTLTVAILGYGRIGRETARKFRAFGCRVLAHDPEFTCDDGSAIAASLELVQAEADVIVIHVPLVPTTRGMIGREFLARTKRSPLIVNVSRGPLVDNDALYEALTRGSIRGAAVDVLDGEPAAPQGLLSHPHLVVTPHVAYASDASIRELRRRACEEVVRVLRGERPEQPRNAPVRGATAAGVPLDGGVASDVRLLDTPDGPIVVKTALPKLKVDANWFSDPTRSLVEVAAIGAIKDLIGPLAVPEIVWAKPREHCFAMRRVDPRLRNWKVDLLAGNVDLGTAARVGELLGMLHTRSSARPDLAKTFADTRYFRELRVEPFFNHVASRKNALATDIIGVAARMLERRTALVHGDYSPKNILANGRDVVVLDFEVTHWGDPRFDVGFCLAHLLLKSTVVGADAPRFERAIDAFLGAYAASGHRVLDCHLTNVVGCLLLARLYGKSPVDYIGGLDRERVEKTAIQMLRSTADPGISSFRILPEQAV